MVDVGSFVVREELMLAAAEEQNIAEFRAAIFKGALAKGLVYEAGEFLQVVEYKNVQRWTDAIAARPAVKRGRMVNRRSGDRASQLRERLRHQDAGQDYRGGVRGAIK
jgi:GST-like protein